MRTTAIKYNPGISHVNFPVDRTEAKSWIPVENLIVENLTAFPDFISPASELQAYKLTEIQK